MKWSEPRLEIEAGSVGAPLLGKSGGFVGLGAKTWGVVCLPLIELVMD